MDKPASEKPEQHRTRHLFRSSGIIGVMTMLSRVVGMARDVVLAYTLGADHSVGADAFYMAFKIPQFLRRLFAEGAFAQAFVPVLSEFRTLRSQEDVKAFIDRVAGALGSTVLLISILVVAGAPWFTMLFAPGFYINDPAKFELTSDLIRITFPYLFLITMTGFAGSILNSYDRFAIPAFTPVLMNISLIAAALLAGHYSGKTVYLLAWGVLVSGVVQLVFQLPYLAQIHLLPVPRWDWQHEGVRRVLTLMVPAMFGVSVGQINLMLDTVVASFLPNGSVTWLYFSDRIAEVPLGVFGIAVATAILPGLSRNHARESNSEFSATIDWALRICVLIGVPASLALMILAEPILATLFQHGKMTHHDIEMASYSLQAYAFGLVSFMLVKVLAPGYYARQDTRTPVRIGIYAMVANSVMMVCLMLPLHFFWQIGHVGLALATTLASFLNAGLLLKGLLQRQIYQFATGWRRFLLRMLVANGAMVGLLLVFLAFNHDWDTWPVIERGLRLGMICASGMACYFAVLYLSGLRVRHFRIRDQH